MAKKGPRLRGGDHKGSARNKHTRSPGYRPGDNWLVCDVCGCHVYSSDACQRWDGMVVCKQDWEPRHEQDFVRARKDQIIPAGLMRPEQEDDFITIPPISGPAPIPPVTSVEIYQDFSTGELGVFDFTRNSEVWFPDHRGKLRRAAPNEPAYVGHNYDNGTPVPTDVSYGLLVENATYNYLPYSEDLTKWLQSGEPIAFSGLEDPIGFNNGYTLYLGAEGVLDIEATTGYIDQGVPELGKNFVGVSFFLKRHSVDATGILRVVNAGHNSIARGNWEIDLALLPYEWTRVNRDHPAVNVITEFQISDTNNTAGLRFFANTDYVAVDIFGAQIEHTKLAGTTYSIWGHMVTSYIRSLGKPKYRNTASSQCTFYADDNKNNVAGQVIFRCLEHVGSYAADINERYYTARSRDSFYDSLSVFKYDDARNTFRLASVNKAVAVSRLGMPFNQYTHDIRFRRTSTEGCQVWAAQNDGVLETNSNPADTEDYGVGINQVAIGYGEEAPNAHVISARFHSADPGAGAVTAWPGWLDPTPIIIQQPEDVAGVVGGNVSISCVVEHPYPHYLWQVKEQSSSTWLDLELDSPNYTFYALVSADVYDVRCLVWTNGGATIYTDTVTLTVT